MKGRTRVFTPGLNSFDKDYHALLMMLVCQIIYNQATYPPVSEVWICFKGGGAVVTILHIAESRLVYGGGNFEMLLRTKIASTSSLYPQGRNNIKHSKALSQLLPYSHPPLEYSFRVP